MEKYEIKNKNRFNIHSIKIIKDYNFKDFERFLKQSTSRLQDYFRNIGIIVDLEELKHDEDFKNKVIDIYDILKRNEFIVMGFTNVKDSQKEWLKDNFKKAVVYEISKQETKEEDVKVVEKVVEKIVEKIVEKVVEIPSDSKTLGFEIYEGIVRGGQQLYSKGKHLLIIGDVKPNGEVVSDGNIIVLGKLNGKAVAGASGTSDSFITANEFKASMISISGNYRQFDEDSKDYGNNVKLLIKDGKLIIEKY